MGKTTVKAALSQLSKDDLVEVLLELYAARKEAKEWLDFWADPNEEQKLQQYCEMVTKEFAKAGRNPARVHFSKFRKSVSDFKKMQASPRSIIDLQLHIVRCTASCRRARPQQLNSAAGYYCEALVTVVANDLLAEYEKRLARLATDLIARDSMVKPRLAASCEVLGRGCPQLLQSELFATVC